MPDPGWVRIYHPDQLEDPDTLPDPDDPDGLDNDKFATVTAESYRDAWTRRGWRNLDEDRAGAAADQLPEKAADRIAWIDDTDTLANRQARATAVLNDERTRDDGGRSTVVAHAEQVLSNTSAEEQTTSTTSDEQES